MLYGGNQWMNDRSIDIVNKRDGKIVAVTYTTVSDDGKALVMSVEEIGDDGTFRVTATRQ